MTRKVLITGATGGMGSLFKERLADDYELVLQGRHPREEEKDQFVIADLADYAEVEPLMEGIDTVLHMAGSASPESSWDDVLTANIIGLRNALEAARVKGVRRFVFASSNHAMGMYDRDEEWPVYPHLLPRPDSLYGVSKVFGETLGRFYHDNYDLEFIALRIGWHGGHPDSVDLDILRAMWLSDDDAVQAVKCAIEADVTFGLYYVISDNPNRRWDITNTMLELGYRPKDTYTDHSDVPEDPEQPTPSEWPEGS